MLHRKSSAAAHELGISYSRLIRLLRSEKLKPPQKDSSGDYVRSGEDLAAARNALRTKQYRKRSDRQRSTTFQQLVPPLGRPRQRSIGSYGSGVSD